jgi:predicted esterase
MTHRLLEARVTAWPVALLVTLFVTAWPGPESCAAAEAQAFERGKIIEKVACLESADQSYALYLPASVPPTAPRPVLYLLDPGARGSVAIEAFRPAAEKFGWILVASNNSRNGPWEPTLKAVRTMWLDSIARLPIDQARVYAGGFSGGARVASLFPGIIGRTIAGIVGVGAGVAEGAVRLDDIGSAAYFGIVGLADFNYPEMKRLDADLDRTSLPHHVLFYDALHQWPDQQTGIRAVGWMEVMAMRQGTRSKDGALIEALWNDEIATASALAASGKTFWAARQYEAVARLFEGLRDVVSATAEAEHLRRSREYESFVKDEKKRSERSASLQREFQRASASVDQSAGDRADLVALLRDLRLDSLKKEASAAREIDNRSFAYRSLVGFSVELQLRGNQSYNKKDWPRAAAFFELATEASPEGDARAGNLYYALACVTARRGDGKTALRHLEAAVGKGFSNVQALETDEDLETIRTTAGFRGLLERVKKAREPVQIR